MKFYRNRDIEEMAANRLTQLEDKIGGPLLPPIPIDLLAEKVLGLDFLWDRIQELPGEIILAAIDPRSRLIVLNQSHQSVFERKPGLERFTKGHEMGHWDLFMDADKLRHSTLFDMNDEIPFVRRRTDSTEVVAIQRLLSTWEGQELVRELNSRADDPDEERAVNRYAAAILMPEKMIRAEAHKVDRTRWVNLYELQKKFGVTISALTVRLSQLDLLCFKRIGNQTTLYGSEAEATGQFGLDLQI